MKIVFELDDHEDKVTPIDTAAALLRTEQFTTSELKQIADHIYIAIDIGVIKDADPGRCPW